MQTLALANQKGGVGKTTTAIHLAHGLAMAGKRVALFDLDPQGNATVAVQGMLRDEESDQGPLVSIGDRLKLLPSPGAQAVLEAHIVPEVRQLRGLTDAIRGETDWLIVDCPPRLDAWGWAGLELCEHALVPVQPEFFAMHGLAQVLASLEGLRQRMPGSGKLRGILPTMVDLQEPLALEVLADLRSNLGDKVLRSVILRDPCLVEAASHGKTVFAYRPSSRAALCYSDLTLEILNG